MISPESSTLLTLCLYGAASLAGISGMMLRSAMLRKAGCWLAGLGFLVQTLMLALGFHSTLPEGLSLGAYLQMLAWFVLLCGLISRLRYRQEATLILSAPLALILFIMSAPYLAAVVKIPPQLSAPFYTLHIGALFLSLGLLTLAFAAGCIFLFLEGRIKSKQAMKGFWQDMPALSLLDRINAFAVMTTFPLYTLGIVAGLVWAKPVFGATFNGDPKEVISLVVWLLLAALFHNRLTRGWRGRKPARLAVIIWKRTTPSSEADLPP